jgi:hypothetical protein
MRLRSLGVIVLSFFLIATISIVWGQGSVGTLNGTVLDPAGAVVPGATVVVVNTSGEERKTTRSLTA